MKVNDLISERNKDEIVISKVAKIEKGDQITTKIIIEIGKTELDKEGQIIKITKEHEQGGHLWEGTILPNNEIHYTSINVKYKCAVLNKKSKSILMAALI